MKKHPVLTLNLISSFAVRNLITYLTLSLTVLFFSGQGAVNAEDKLPTAEEIINKYIEATGGKKAYEKIQTRVIKETMEVLQPEVKVALTTWQARPNKKLSRVKSESQGNLEKGTDGKTAWFIIENRGERIITGPEKADYFREASFDTFIGWQDRYLTAECTGIEDADSTSCFKVVMTPEEGNPQTYFFALDSYLILRSEMQIGKQKVTTYYLDYKEVDGIMIAHKKKQIFGDVTRFVTIETIVQNEKFREDLFRVPEKIQDMLENK